MKLVIVTGGVLSGLGKGITGASIGALLKAAGYKIFMQKLDGYLNVDPGTMNPVEHGEVFVMEDGFESDLDLGHYERFIDTNLNKYSSYTTGRIFEEIIGLERAGKFLGQTVQIIPHVTDMVKAKIRHGIEQSGADIGIVEIGGTVGDIENEYLIEATRQLRQELGANQVQFVHLTYVPYLAASKELKTKPTQASIKDLRQRGIHPDFVVVRADTDIPESILAKISHLGGIARDHVVPAPTIETIYQVPLDYHMHSVGHHILDGLELPYSTFDLTKRQSLHTHFKKSVTELRIALVGKYVDLEDAYYSLNESIKVAGRMHERKVILDFLDAEKITDETSEEILGGYAGICVPGGFGTRGVEGMIATAKYAREQKVPYLGICLGSQIMAIEFARNVLGVVDATSEEFASDVCPHPQPLYPQGAPRFQKEREECRDGSIIRPYIVHLMETQKGVEKKGGTMRLGSYPCDITASSLVGQMYAKHGREEEVTVGSELVQTTERHRHRYEFNNDWREKFEKAGFAICGTSPDGQLVEMVEITDHPCMVATQAHPELKSRPTYVHPLVMGWMERVLLGL